MVPLGFDGLFTCRKIKWKDGTKWLMVPTPSSRSFLEHVEVCTLSSKIDAKIKIKGCLSFLFECYFLVTVTLPLIAYYNVILQCFVYYNAFEERDTRKGN